MVLDFLSLGKVMASDLGTDIDEAYGSASKSTDAGVTVVAVSPNNNRQKSIDRLGHAETRDRMSMSDYCGAQYD